MVPQSPHRLDDNEENEEEFFSSDDDILMEDEGESYYVNKNEIVKDAKEMLAEGVAAEKLPGRFKEVFSEYLSRLRKARTTKKQGEGDAKSGSTETNNDGEKANVSNSTANDGDATKDGVPAVTAHAVTAPAVMAPAVTAAAVTSPDEKGPAEKKNSAVKG